jgi:DNA repair exonuclease SbcCD ATPase subunit
MSNTRQASEVHPEISTLQKEVADLKTKVKITGNNLETLTTELQAAKEIAIGLFQKTQREKSKDMKINPSTAAQLVDAKKNMSTIQNLVGTTALTLQRTQTALTAKEAALMNAQKEHTAGQEKNVTTSYRPGGRP